mgnify:CR=1 FL=1
MLLTILGLRAAGHRTMLVAHPNGELRRRAAEGLELLPLAPWDPEPKPFFVRIRADELTGRRLPLRAGGVTVERQRGETD